MNLSPYDSDEQPDSQVTGGLPEDRRQDGVMGVT